MMTQVDKQLDRETLSALMDGQLRGAEASAALRMMASTEAGECWQVYHLVGDVLRSSDLAGCGRDSAFLARLNARLQEEARPTVMVSARRPADARDVSRPAANDGVFRWKMVAGLASFAAVAAIGWSVMGSLGPQPGTGAQLAQGPSAQPTQVMSLMAGPGQGAPQVALAAASEPADMGDVMLRDPRLDELLAAHRQSAGVSALGNAAGFLRNATFEGSGR